MTRHPMTRHPVTRTLSALTLTALLALPVLAQTGISFDGLKTDPTAPLQVQADALSVAQADNTAVFTGNVVVNQADMQLNAAQMTVVYAEGGTGIAELRASGGVTVKAGPNVAAAEEAIYTVASTDLVMTGNVILTMEQATIAGEGLTINLTTGLGTMTGRVTTTFAPAKN